MYSSRKGEPVAPQRYHVMPGHVPAVPGEEWAR